MRDIKSMQRVSTRLAFLAAGMGTAAWAALVPIAKARLGLDAAELGLLLLCLGVGSLSAMPVTGMWASRFGCRPVILAASALACVVLPFLAIAPSPLLLAGTLLVFGAAIGTLDVAMNIQAVIVERADGGALMSGFHGLFSVGGFVGAGGMAALLWAGLSPFAACSIIAVSVGAVVCFSAPYLLRASASSETSRSHFAIPHGAVIVIGIVCFAVFLAEGAMLDWSGLLLTSNGGFTTNEGGLGYAVFAIAMTVGRLTGDLAVRRWGRKRVLLYGGLCTAAGFFGAVLASTPGVALIGFLLIGIGASNIVPILFTAAGNQGDMPTGSAISAITTLGYAGILAGPALIGFVARASSLHVAFGALGFSMLLVAASSRLSLIADARIPSGFQH